MKKNSILCLLLALLLLFSAFSVFAEGEDEAEIEEAPGERVNFLIAGIDHKSNGTTTSGTDVHADTVIIVAVDFENKKVDLISLARDTFIHVPGHNGYYKLNAAFNVGGGMDDPDGGFLALAATAGEVLGGVSIPYYIAVDISSLQKLVDAIGGVDMDVEMTYTTTSGYTYQAGYQHLDGTGFVHYVRSRKRATVNRNDIGRTNRQRQALLALYKKVRSEGIITNLPSIFFSMKDGVWTNISLTQMATLANFALGFDPDTVGMHSMTGYIKVNHGWAYHFIDQQARKELLKSIYGFDADPYGIASESYVDYLHDIGFNARKSIAQAEKAFDKLQAQMEEGKEITDKQVQLYTDAYLAYEEAIAAIDALDEFMSLYCDGIPKEARAEYNEVREAVNKTQKTLKKTATALGQTVRMRLSDFKWVVWPVYYRDTDINEMIVDFN